MVHFSNRLAADWFHTRKESSPDIWARYLGYISVTLTALRSAGYEINYKIDAKTEKTCNYTTLMKEDLFLMDKK